MLILASGSPRRKELLALIAEDFETDIPKGEETITPDTPPEKAVEELALCKAREIAAKRGGSDTILAADTVVVLDGAILGKPASRENAAEMLRSLSGRSHMVYTGVCVKRGEYENVFHSGAEVTFAPMTDTEIEEYLDTNEPFDKAGAYGIQGFGARYIEKIAGDYHAVVGLPVRSVYTALKAVKNLNGGTI